MSKLIVGVDEVGVGSIAGPLIVAAVVFTAETPQPVLRIQRGKRWREIPICDSKKVQHDLLPAFRTLILSQCLASALSYKLPHEVDELGPDGARDVATAIVVHRVLERIKLFPIGQYESYMVILDGDVTSPTLDAQNITYHAIAHADRDVWQVSAASLLAKEAQVLHMGRLHKKHPHYGWDHNHGYPTADHVAALRERGVTRYHRRSYRTVKEVLQ